MMLPRKLSPEELRRVTDPAMVRQAEAEESSGRTFFIGQERAAAALRFGLRVRGSGFHIYAAGPSGAGKETLARRYCEEIARGLSRGDDWCYVHNFADPDRPRALRLRSGEGQAFAREMIGLVQDIRRELKVAFRAESFQGMRDAIVRELEEVQESELSGVDSLAASKGFRVERRPESFITIPLQENGEPISSEAYTVLPQNEKASLAERERLVTARLKAAISHIQDVEEKVRSRLEKLEREVALHTLGPLFEAIRGMHGHQPQLLDYLSDVADDVLDHLELFSVEPEEDEEEDGEGEEGRGGLPRPFDPLEPTTPGPLEVPHRYRVNPLACCRDGQGAAVVFESHPTLYNLLGRVHRPFALAEQRPANFLDLKGGSLHRANGGFLIIHALDVLKEPFAWEGLKRALRDGKVGPARPREELGLETESLRPEPIELDVVVVLLGEEGVYQELLAQDPDFASLFSVKAQFSETVARNAEAEKEYARFIRDRCREKGLFPLTAEAIARVIDEASVMAGSQDRLSACFRRIADLLQEAHLVASDAGRQTVERQDVEATLLARLNRVNLYEEHLQQMVERGEILLEVTGRRVGQVNALAVFDLGDHVFARPSRITCTVGLGQGGLVDIEREAELGGPIHTKGVLILRGFLLSRFATAHPLTLSASMAFEQSYGLIDGDSASLAELVAMLSAISRIPVRQDIAVTGSINQLGRLQAIGGVTEKVTGFFHVCCSRGLTGEQGVIVPESNVRQLMLPTEVVEAVRAGKFSVWAASDVAAALELLTGVATGEGGDGDNGEQPGAPEAAPKAPRRVGALDGADRFPPGTLYAAVASRLREMNAALSRL